MANEAVDEGIATAERINAFMRKRRVEDTCPFCGQHKWIIPSPGSTFISMTPQNVSGVMAYVLVCVNCGFIRQIACDVVEERVDLRREHGIPVEDAP